MDGDGILKIQQSAENAVDAERRHTEINGMEWFVGQSGALTLVPNERPIVAAKTLTVHTLDGLVQYAKTQLSIDTGDQEFALADCAFHVASHEAVWLMSPLQGEQKLREYFAQANYTPLLGSDATRFEYGHFYGPESFAIHLQTLFTQTEQRDALLSVLGTVQAQDVVTSHEDGVTQSVVAQAGKVSPTRSWLPNPVTMAPFRTFREVDQPASAFILRAKAEPGQVPKFALFEADGGAWKLAAIKRIAAYLTSAETGLRVIA